MDEQIKKIGQEMNRQDCRMTQYPLYIVVVDEKIYGSLESTYRERKPDYDHEKLCEACANKYDKDEDVPDECDECDDDTMIDYAIRHEVPDLQAGVFFTAKACEQHIKENHYHYNNPKSFAIGAWRNDEMVAVMQHVAKIGADGGEIASFYK